MSRLELFGLRFHPYGFVLGIAVLAGFRASTWLAKRRKIPVQLIEGLFWWVVIGGIIGARVYHVVDKWKEIYSLDPVSSLYLWNGGLGIWGAVIGGIAGLYLFLQKTQKLKNSKTQDFVSLLDVVVIGAPLGQAIGRWGNFFNNEIVGRNGEPLFLYESVLDLALFGVLVRVSRMGQVGRIGHIAGIYLIGYGLIRLVLEPLRPESIIWKTFDVPTASLVSVLAITIGAILICWRRRS